MTARTCCVDDCTRVDIKARGLCGRCYAQAQRGKIPTPPLVREGATPRAIGVKELRQCGNCKEPFEARPHERTKYCSKRCYGQSKRKELLEFNCLTCGDAFYVPQRRKLIAKYCSVACRGLANRLAQVVTCSHPGCETRGSSSRLVAREFGLTEITRGLCRTHYSRLWKHGDSSVTLPSGGVRASGVDHHRYITDLDRIGYVTAHNRAKALWGAAKQYPCIDCGGPATQWAYDGTDPMQKYDQTGSGTWCFYSVWPEFYMPMCSGCHRARDGAIQSGQLQAFRTLLFESGLTSAELMAFVRESLSECGMTNPYQDSRKTMEET